MQRIFTKLMTPSCQKEGLAAGRAFVTSQNLNLPAHVLRLLRLTGWHDLRRHPPSTAGEWAIRQAEAYIRTNGSETPVESPMAYILLQLLADHDDPSFLDADGLLIFDNQVKQFWSHELTQGWDESTWFMRYFVDGAVEEINRIREANPALNARLDDTEELFENGDADIQGKSIVWSASSHE